MAEATQTPGGTPQAHTLSASGADVLTLPEGLSVSEAEFAVDGSDLVLTFPDGSKVTVENYYEQAQPPQLASADGANLSGDMVVQLTGTPETANASALQQFADASGTQVIGGTDGAPIGSVKTITGEVWVTRADGTRVQLQAGDQVFQGDNIETGSDGAIGVLLADETTFSMGEASQMVLDEMVYDPATQNGSLNVSVVQGVFTFVSGQVAKTDPDAMKIDTPVATIGIRGTQVGIEIPPDGEMQIVLMQEADGFVGEVVIENNSGQLVMNRGGDFVTIPSYDSTATSRGTMSDDDIVERHATTLKHLPVESTDGERTSGNHFGLQEEIEQGAGQEQGQNEEQQPSAEELANTETAAGQEDTQQTPDDLNQLNTQAGGQEGFTDDVVKVTEGFDPLAGNTQDLGGTAGIGGVGGGDIGGFDVDFTNVTDDIDTLAVAEQAAIEVARQIAASAVARAQAAAASASTSADNSDDPRVDAAADDTEAALARALQAQAEANAATTSAEANAAAQRANDAAADAEASVEDIADFLQDVADAPTLDVTSAEEGSGLRGNAIELDVQSALTDTDGSETLSVTISGVPEGATLLLGGEAVTVADGVATLTGDQLASLANLSVIPADDSGEDFQLTVTATSTETATGDTATTTATIDVDVNRDVLTGGDDTFQMDDDSVVYAGEGNDTITGTSGDDVVFGEEGDDTFIAGQGGSDAFIGGAGTDTVDYSALDPASPLYVNLTEEAGQSGVAVPLFDFDQDGDIDADDAAGAAASGDHDFDLLNGIENVVGGAGDDIIVGSDGTNVLIGGLGDDILAGGGGDDTIIGGDGTDTAVFEDNFEEFTVNLDSDSGELSVGGSAVDGNDTLTGVEVLQFGDLTITVEDLLNAAMPDLDVSAVDTSTTEDVAVALPIEASLADGVDAGTETLSVTLSGIPEGAVLSAGGVELTVENGSITFADGVVPEDLTILPPADSAADFNITVSATSQSVATVDGVAQTTTSEQVLTVTVAPDAEAPVVTPAEADALTFNEDSGAIDVGALFDAVAVEPGEVVASFTIGGLPEGATLTGTFEDNGDGTFTIDAADLGGVRLTLPEDYDDNFALQVSATASQTDPETGSVDYATSDPVSVPLNIIAQADAPTAAVEAASGVEDGGAIPLTIDATTAAEDINGEITSFTVSDIPVGATLNLPGGLTFTATDGNTSVDLTPEMVDGLSITLPEDFDTDFSLSVTATAEERDPDTGEITEATSAPVSLDVSVGAVADAPTVQVDAASGTEDGGPIALNIDPQAAAQDINGEVVSVTIAGVPAGATLSAGSYDAATGEWTVDAADVGGLSIALPDDFDADFTLQVSATAEETDPETNVTTSATSAPVPLAVSVIAQVDAPTVDVAAATGDEDTAIALEIDPAAAAQDIQGEVTSVTISDIPPGATLTLANGIQFTATDGNTSLSLPPAQIEGLTITPPADSADDFQLTVTATATETDPNTGEVTTATSAPATLDVIVQGVADGAQVTDTSATGVEDTAIAFALNVSELDTDGSETLSVTLSDIPVGAVITRNGEPVAVNADGTVTLGEGELDGLSILPPVDFSGNIALTVSATTTDEGDDSEAALGTVSIDVTGAADGPGLVVDDVTGNEDTAIPLDITATLADGSETLGLSISGIPDGAVLTITNPGGQQVPVTVVDGVAEIPPGLIGGQIFITPPVDSADDFPLTVTATSNDNGSLATTEGTLNVTVQGVADGAAVADTAATGAEDTAIPFTLNVSELDTDGSETLSVTLSDIPAGAVITRNGEPVAVNADGTVTLGEGELDGLAITPPADFSGNIALTVSAQTTDEGDVSDVTTGTVSIDVAGVADGAAVADTVTSGDEDTGIALAVDITKADDSETAEITLSGIPQGAVLSNANGSISIIDGVAVLSEADLAGLQITPPADSDADFQLGVSVVTTDGDSTSDPATGTITVGVDGVADVPSLSVDSAVSGAEDGGAIALDISSVLTDVDGSESLSITISGVPQGATLSAGAYDAATDSWTLSAADLDGLTVTPAADSGADFQLTVTATSTEADGDTASQTATVDVTVTSQADAPTVTTDAASGVEDGGAIALNIDADAATQDIQGEVTSFTISDIPVGATLNLGGGFQFTATEGNTSVNLTPGMVDGMSISLPEDFDTDFSLTVTATAEERDPDTGAVTTATSAPVALAVSVDAVADAPTVAVGNASDAEDGGPIALNIDPAAAAEDINGEVVSVTITGVPGGATLSAGSYDSQTGEWTLTPEDLDGLTVTLPEDFDEDFTLQVSSTAEETDPETGTVTTATSDPVALDVSVIAQVDAPTVLVAAATGDEDTAIALVIDPAAAAQDINGEIVSVTISDIPPGAMLTLPGGLTFTASETNTSVSLTPAQLDGLTITPPADSADDFALTITATARETDPDTGEVTIATSDPVALDVMVQGVADGAAVADTTAAGAEDTAIPLTVDVTELDTDGSETLSVTLSGIPEGAVLTRNGEPLEIVDGSVTLAEGELDGLAITPPADFAGSFNLTVSAQTTDEGDVSEAATGTISVDVGGAADGAAVTLGAAQGDEDTAIDLPIAIDKADASETAQITLSGIPQGAVLSNANGPITVTDGVATLSEADLAGLRITAPTDSGADFQIGVSVVTTDGDSTSEPATGTINVGVDAVADVPSLSVGSVTGTEDSAIPLNIAAGLNDTDGSEVLSVTISDVPPGATLTLADGSSFMATPENTTFLFTGDQLTGLTITPPENSDADFALTVIATSLDTDPNTGAVTTSSVEGTMAVSVDPDADAPTLSLGDSAGTEDLPIALNIDAGLTDDSEVLSVTISGVPEGASLSAGEYDAATGTWTLSSGDLEGLTITPPADSNEDFALTVTATSTESDGSTATTTSTLNVAVTGDADAPTLTVDLGEGVPSGGGGTEEIPGSVTVTNVGNASAGFHNTYGYYVMGPDGTPQSGEIVWADVKDSVGDTFTLDGVDPDDIGFFVIPNGDNLNPNITDGMDVTFSQGADGQWYVVGPDGQNLSGQGDPVLFSDPALNENQFDYTQDSGSPGNQNWEDLVGGGDNDFNDINMNVTTVATQPGTSGDDAVVEYPLDINAALTDTDGSETLSATVSGVPEGATLTLADGTILTSTGATDTFDLTADQLQGITLSVPADASDFDLSVTATATENDGDTANVSTSVAVDLPEPTGPDLTVVDAQGDEDTAIALNIAAAFEGGGSGGGDTTGSFYLLEEGSDSVLRIGLDGAIETVVTQDEITALTGEHDADLDDMSVVTDGDGNVYFTEADSDSILMKPADGGDLQVVASKSDIMAATGDNGADPRGLVIGSDGNLYMTDEDSDSLLRVDPATGEVTVVATEQQLDDLAGIHDVDLEGGMIATPDGKIHFVSAGDPDAVFTYDIATGESSVLAKGGDFNDLDSYMALAPNGDVIVIDESGDNSGAFDNIYRIDAETGEVSVFLSNDQLRDVVGHTVDLEGGISFDADGNFYIAEEQSDSIFKFSATDPATGAIDPASGEVFVSRADINDHFQSGANADLEGDLFFAQMIADGDDSLSITISDIPEGAVLAVNGEPVTVTEGTAELTADQLAGLTITPPADSDADFALSVTATGTAANGQQVSSTASLNVTVDAVADAPVVTAEDASGTEDQPIALDITATLADMDGSESITGITISGVPAGATLNNGTYDAATDTWTLQPADLVDLELTPAVNSNEDFQLTITATSQEADGGDTAVGTVTMDVDVAGVVDDFTVSALDAAGEAGSELPLSIDVGLTDLDGSETVSVTLTGIPEGAILNHGTFDEGTGNWTLSGDDLEGLTISLPETVEGEGDGAPRTLYSQNFNNLSDGATSASGDSGFSSTGGTGSDDRTAADNDRFEFQNPTGGDISTFSTAAIDISGQEDVTFSFDLRSHGDMETHGSAADYVKVFAVVDGVEHELMTHSGGLSNTTFTLDDIPEGDELVIRMEVRTTGGDEVYKMDNLSVVGTPAAAEPLESFQIGVETTVTESDGASESHSTTLNVEINNDNEASAPTLTVTEQAPTTEDVAVTLNIAAALTDTDGSESLSVTISGIPDGAVLKAGDTVLTVENGEITFADGVVPDNLSLTPPANSDADIDLTVSATSTEENGGATATTTSTIAIDVSALADVPAITGVTVGEPVITEGADGDAETVTISTANFGEDGAGFTVAARTINPDGSLSEPSADNVSTNGSPLGFGVAGGASGADSELGYDSQHGVSEELIVSFDDGVESADVAFAWMNSGENAVFKLYRDGVEVGTGTINGGSDGIDDPVTLTATDGGTFDQIVFSAPGHGDDYLINSISFETPAGTSDVAEYPIDISASLADADGSEDLSVTIGGVPAGAALSAGADNGDGTWTVSGGELEGLTLSVPFEGEVESFDLTFTAKATEQSNNSVATSASVVATVAAVVAPEPAPEPEPVEEDFDGDDMNNDQMVDGDNSKDEWTGDWQSETFAGSTKNDELETGGGGDTLYGGAGNDELKGSWGEDTFYGGSGNDELDGGDQNDVLYGGSGNDEIDGGTGNDQLFGGSGNDEIEGDHGDDTIFAGSGNDEIDAGTGNDTVYGGSGNDEIKGDHGDDVIYGGTGNDEIDGGTGNDILFGGSGDDVIFGDHGNDIISGGAGNDILNGGSGNDTFIFDADSGHDIIEDIMMQDTLEFQGEQFDMNDMIFSENEDGDAVISFAGNDDMSVTLEGVKFSDLDANGDGDASEGYSVTQTDDGFSVNIDET